MESSVLQILSGLGDVSMVAVAVGFWRLDKRLSHLEWWKENIPNECCSKG